jgi:predicted ABC-type ATPase
LNPSRPKLLIVAGANGAGKSTLTRRWSRRFQNRLGPVLDPDEIAQNLNPLNPPLASIRAARTVLGSTSKFLNQGSSFVIETTLSDRNRHLDLIEQAHVQGFRVWLFYVGLEKSGLHLNRVADRVRGGGHDVPDVDILRRLSRSERSIGDCERGHRCRLVDTDSEIAPRIGMTLNQNPRAIHPSFKKSVRLETIKIYPETRLPMPSASNETKSVFALTPSTPARSSNAACKLFGRRASNLPLT